MSADNLIERQRTNRLTLIGLLIIFASPMVIAYVGWLQGWFSNVGTTNHGELLRPMISLQQSGLQLKNENLTADAIKDKWWLIYVADDKSCDLTCQANAYLINQIRTSQGKEMARIDRMVVTKFNPFTAKAEAFIRQHFNIKIFPTLKERSPLKSNNIYLMDPLGNIFMRYESVEDEKEAVLKGKGIVKDLKKLLKYSQIG